MYFSDFLGFLLAVTQCRFPYVLEVFLPQEYYNYVSCRRKTLVANVYTYEQSMVTSLYDVGPHWFPSQQYRLAVSKQQLGQDR